MAVTSTYSLSSVENINPSNITSNADAVGLADGGVAVVGDRAGNTDATIFAADGATRGSAEAIAGSGAAVSQLSNGNIVIATDNGGEAVFTVLDASGGVVGAQTGTGEVFNDISDVDVAGLTGGGFVLATQAFFSGSDNDIRIYVRNGDGSTRQTITIDASLADDQNPSVAGLTDGGFVVAWHRNVGDGTQLYYAVYNGDGSQRKAPSLFDATGSINRNASVVALANNGFAIAYEDNGGGDIDVTLARFDASGNLIGQSDISQTDYNDTMPSTTLLSNGMIVVGSINDLFSDTDPVWTLVDPNTGTSLATSSTGFTFNNDTQPTVGGMALGQVGAFFTDTGSGTVSGQILQATRNTNGDDSNDVFVGDDLIDYVYGAGGADRLSGGGNDDFLYGQAGNDRLEGGSGDDYLDGGADTDTLLGGAGNDTLDGGGGADRLFGGAGDDTYIIGNSGVVVSELANEGIDTVRAVGNYTLSANVENLVLTGASGNGFGNALNNTLTGNAGNNVLDGKSGADTMIGGIGNDTYVIDNLGDVIVEVAGEGNDTVRAAISYTMADNTERLELTSVSNISGTGNAGANTIVGFDGANRLTGLGGKDTLTGGLGRDTFAFTALGDSTAGANGRDTITDFNQSQFDRIDLSGIDANAGVEGDQAFTLIGTAGFSGAAGQLRFEASGTDTLLLGDVDGNSLADFSVLLTGQIALTRTDFVF